MGNIELTGYPHIDNIHKQYYGEKGQQKIDVNKSMFRYIYDRRFNFDGVALEFYGKKITYKEMFDQIIKYASAFKEIGIKQGDVVTLLMPSSPDTYYMIYALSILGAVRNMVDLRTSTEGIKKYINDSKSEYIICMNNTPKKTLRYLLDATSIRQIITTGAPLETINNRIVRAVGSAALLANEASYHSLGSRIVLPNEFTKIGEAHIQPIENLETKYKEGTPTLYLHTSGTMKFPKTVVGTDEAQNFVATQYEKSIMDLQERDRFLAIMPPWIFYGIMGFHMPFSLGMTVLPIPDPNSVRFDDLILDLKPNHVAGVPNHFIQLHESPRITPTTDLSFAKTFACGGAAINSEKQEEISEMLLEHGAKSRLNPGYSYSENTSVGTANQGIYQKNGSVGIPLPDIEVMVIDQKTHEPLKYNETGIICLRGALMEEYLHDKEETDQVMITVAGKKWAISGDIGHVDEEGFVFVEGREKNVIIGPDGFKIAPNEIESIICTHPEVKNCIVLGIKDKNYEFGDRPMAYIELKDKTRTRREERKIAEEIKDSCSKKLSSYYLPIGYYFGKILFTPMMKDDKPAMRAKYEEELEKGPIKRLILGTKVYK